MERKCLQCGDEIIGRIDKKYCSDQCRNAYNNSLNSDVNNYVRNTNRVLKKNRRILQELNPNGKAKASREKLLRMGFNFNYLTSIYTTRKGTTYYFCYEQGYLPLDNNYYSLLIKENYLE